MRGKARWDATLVIIEDIRKENNNAHQTKAFNIIKEEKCQMGKLLS